MFLELTQSSLVEDLLALANFYTRFEHFLSDGKLRVTSVATGIARLKSDGTHVDVYSSDGIKIRHNVIVSEALNDLPEGIYIIGNQKVVKK